MLDEFGFGFSQRFGSITIANFTQVGLQTKNEEDCWIFSQLGRVP
jgi:hypothetical protein